MKPLHLIIIIVGFIYFLVVFFRYMIRRKRFDADERRTRKTEDRSLRDQLAGERRHRKDRPPPSL